MKKYCPNAWLINFTNPAGIVTEAILRYTDFKKIIGLCNVPITMHMGIANLLGIEQNRIRLEISGLNHHVFVTNTFLDGESIQDKVVDKYCNLKDEEVVLLEEEEAILADIKRLSDPLYVARYAREKYLQ